MRRIQRPAGQLLLSFELSVEDAPEPVQVSVAEPVVEVLPEEIPSQPEEATVIEPVEAAPLAGPKLAKQRTRQVFRFEGPAVMLHKHGSYLMVKPNDPEAALAWADIRERMYVEFMQEAGYYDGQDQDTATPNKEDLDGKIRLWSHLGDDLLQLPMLRMLRSYGIQVEMHPTLAGWLQKARRRWTLENTPFPVPPVETDIALFDRCSEGTILRCTKDFLQPNTATPLFRAGNRYMVVSTGGEGRDVIVLSTEPVADKAVLTSIDKTKTFEWTSFHQGMEDWFDDSEETETGPDIKALYPQLVEAMEKKLEASGLKDKLYEHVQQDVVLMALKHGGINAYPMRMGKSSFAITWAKLKGCKQVAMIGPRNARIFTVKELERLGFKRGEDFIEVESLADLEQHSWMYLLTYTWLRKIDDPTYKQRLNWENLLRPSKRQVKRKIGEGRGDTEWVEQELRHLCPHCNEPLFRLDKLKPGEAPPLDGVRMYEERRGRRYDVWFKWTTERGYLCRNKDCSWITDNRAKQMTRWNNTKLTRHKGGYVNWELAAHAGCPDDHPRDARGKRSRQCGQCKRTDGVWTPPLYRRLTKRFSAVIPDEIHACKDSTTATSISTFNLRARNRLGLTGTLLSNSPVDAYWPLHWTIGAPSMRFPYFRNEGLKKFDNRFCDAMTLEKPIGEEVNAETGERKQITKAVRKRIPFLKNPPDFWRFMVDKVVRRTYNDPLFQKTLRDNKRFMPKTEIIKHPCYMDAYQAQIMLGSIKDFRAQFEKMQKEAQTKGQEVNPAMVISQMAILRTVATCPEMLNTTIGPGTYKGKPGGGKMEHIVRICNEAKEKGKKVLIGSDFLAMQKAVEEALQKEGHDIVRFNTSWDDEARREAFERFQDGDANIFVAGTRAVREGVDLSAADIVICCDLLWSPAFQTQFWSRAMAPQTRDREVKVYLMVSANSLDEHIYTVFYSKMVAAEQAMDRKVLNRRATEFDVKWFVERVVEEEAAIAGYLARQSDDNTIPIAADDFDSNLGEEREA